MGPGCSRMPLAILLPSSLAGTVQPHFLSPNLTQTRNIPTSAHCPCTKSYKILIKLDNLWISPFLRQCGAVSTDCPKGGFVFFKSILPLSTSLGAVAAGGWAQLFPSISAGHPQEPAFPCGACSGSHCQQSWAIDAPGPPHNAVPTSVLCCVGALGCQCQNCSQLGDHLHPGQPLGEAEAAEGIFWVGPWTAPSSEQQAETRGIFSV